MRWLKAIGILFLILLVFYFAGPDPSTPVFQASLPSLPNNADSLEALIATSEHKHPVKPGNAATILWADSIPKKTRYAFVYLHGFSASHQEGNPVHTTAARTFRANLYLARLATHGLDTADPMVNLTATALWESAKEAYAVGKQLGDSVILIGTSTGGSLALQLAATYPEVAGLVLMSPNIAINDPNAWILNNPWGLQIARLVKNGKYNEASNKTAEYKKYWYYKYRLESAVQLQEYLETAMVPETFAKIKQPVLTLYYYKDEQHQDPVVKVSAMQNMMKNLGTPASSKKEVAIPEAGNHVLGSYIVSKDVAAVEQEIVNFLSGTMKLQPAFVSNDVSSEITAKGRKLLKRSTK